MFTKNGVITNLEEGFQFTEEGRVFISKESWSNNSVVLEFATIQETIGICPKYVNEQNYLFISLTNEEILISARIKGAERLYKRLNDFELRDENTLLFETVSDTKHIISLNGVEIYQLDSSLFTSGRVFVCGKEGEVLKRCLIEQPQSVAWSTNAGDPGVLIASVQKDNQEMFKMVSAGEVQAAITQNIIIENDRFHISFDCLGEGRLLVNGQLKMEFNALEKKRHSCLVDAEEGGVTISFETFDELYIGSVQVEEQPVKTAYIPNASTTESAVREATVLAYPSKDAFHKEEGSLYIKITPQTTLQNHHVFCTDSGEFSLEYATPSFIWRAMGSEVHVHYFNNPNESIELIATWSEYGISLTVDGEKEATSFTSSPTKKVEKLIFANEDTTIEPVILEEWALFKKEIASFEGSLDEASMHSLFEGGITGKNASWTEVPLAPQDHSPIIVEKEDETPLQKVSFFNHETGEYQTYNEETFYYDGESDFVELAFSNINEQFSKVGIVTEEGERIGEPYRIKGKRLFFTLAGYEKIMYKNQLLKAVYQVKDSYTIDYNIEAVDGYRIDFAAHDGTDRFIYQEGNQYGEPVKLATMIEMNPVLNSQQSGFMYVSKTINSTEDFRITATPDRLLADGFSKSTFVIEPLDYQGNFVSHADLEVEAEKGFIARYINKEAAEAQKRSGHYLYQYIAPFIRSNESIENIEDHIRIIDKDNNIGVVCKILLRPTSQAHALQVSTSEKALLKNKSVLMNHVIMHEGLEEREDAELFNILDLNQDSKITLKEIDILEKGERDFEVSALVQKLQKWKGDEVRANS